MGADHHHFGVGSEGFQRSHELDPVHAGHRQVHDDDVRCVPAHQLDGFLTVAGLTHDLLTRLLEAAADPVAQDLMVVGEDDPDAHVGAPCLVAPLPAPDASARSSVARIVGMGKSSKSKPSAILDLGRQGTSLVGRSSLVSMHLCNPQKNAA